jgi:hypothetical protein
LSAQFLLVITVSLGVGSGHCDFHPALKSAVAYRMRNDEMWLVGAFSLVCCVLAVAPKFTVRVLSYGKPSKSEWLIDAFQLMGCAGLVLVVIRGALYLFF